jgi:hypothetical protein
VIDKSYQAGGKENFAAVYKSDVSLANSPNPSFALFKIKSEKLCNGDMNAPLKLRVFNSPQGGQPTCIGSAVKSI